MMRVKPIIPNEYDLWIIKINIQKALHDLFKGGALRSFDRRSRDWIDELCVNIVEI